MGKINWDDLHGEEIAKAINDLVAERTGGGPYNVWPESTPEEDEAFEKACADYDRGSVVPFK